MNNIQISNNSLAINYNYKGDKNNGALALEFKRIPVVFTMNYEDIYERLFQKIQQPLPERPWCILLDRNQDECQIQLINARVFLYFSEALDFAEAIDDLYRNINE